VKDFSFLSAFLCIALLLICVAIIGCARSSDGASRIFDPSKGGLEGNWEYLVMNAFEAQFSGCTGDAAVLEGATFYQAQALAPMCLVAGRFEVLQVGDAFQVRSHEVTCSDGTPATVSGVGQIGDSLLGGQWESDSAQGIHAVQVFSGSAAGNTIAMNETRRSFSGALEGTCDITPPLTARVTVQ
jgi:hypothetical protein